MDFILSFFFFFISSLDLCLCSHCFYMFFNCALINLYTVFIFCSFFFFLMTQIQWKCPLRQGLWECLWVGLLLPPTSGTGGWWFSQPQTLQAWWWSASGSVCQGEEKKSQHTTGQRSSAVLYWERGMWSVCRYILCFFFAVQIIINLFCYKWSIIIVLRTCP